MIETLVRLALKQGFDIGSCSDPSEWDAIGEDTIQEFLFKYAPGFHGQFRDAR